MSVCRCCYFEVVAHRGLVVTSVQALVWHNRCSMLLALTVTASSMTLLEHPESQEFNPFAEESLPGALDDPYYMNDEEEKLENEKKSRTKLALLQHMERYRAELARRKTVSESGEARRATFTAYDRAAQAAELAAASNPGEDYDRRATMAALATALKADEDYDRAATLAALAAALKADEDNVIVISDDEPPPKRPKPSPLPGFFGHRFPTKSTASASSAS